MSGRNEDNFLDELTPLLRREPGRPRRCPDAEILCAVLDGEASQVLRNAVVAHTAKCSACASLQQRLLAFRQAGGSDADWHRTEQRLDNWLEGWLAMQPARIEPRVAEPWWRPHWGWAVAGVLAMVLAAGLLILDRGRATRPAGIAAIPRVPAPPAAGAPPDAKPAEDFEKSLTATIAEVVRPGDRAPAPVRPSTAAQASVGTATAAPSGGGAVPVRGTVSAPAQVHLDAGTRLWVFLRSLHSRPDQSFEFHGVVLLPVTDGTVVLDQETEVWGTGQVKQGRPSVRIQQFGVHGRQYRLTGPAAATGEQAGGAGGSLQFDAGQVLEMWLASSSTYQKVSGETGQP